MGENNNSEIVIGYFMVIIESHLYYKQYIGSKNKLNYNEFDLFQIIRGVRPNFILFFE